MTAAELKALRGELGLSQARLAAKLGVSLRMLAYWEAGRWPVPKSIAISVKSFVDKLHCAAIDAAIIKYLEK
jgi:DNA-binding transcriptional regulator YiaG